MSDACRRSVAKGQLGTVCTPVKPTHTQVLEFLCSNFPHSQTLLSLAREEIKSCHSVSPSNVLRAFSMAEENCLYLFSDLYLLSAFSPLPCESDMTSASVTSTYWCPVLLLRCRWLSLKCCLEERCALFGKEWCALIRSE